MRKNFIKTFFVGISVALFLIFAATASAGDIDVPNDYLTIQDAINAASIGDIINVAAATYTENVVINKSLSLIGANKTTTTIDGNNVGNTITITASNVTVSGFNVTGGWQNGGNVFYPYGGVVVDGNSVGSALTGIIIKDNIIDGNSGNGVYVSASGDGGAVSNVVIKDCQISNNGMNNAGISLTYPNYITRPVGVWDEWKRPKNILIQGNTIYSNTTYGLYVSAGKDVVIQSNIMRNNSKYGIQLASSWNRTDIPCEYTMVENNDIYDNVRNGIKLTSFNQYNTFTGNNIYNNGNGGSSTRYKYGFLFQDGNDNMIQNNTITANALGGLYLWGNGDPSYTWYSTTNNTITGNTISDHSGGYGIYIPVKNVFPNSGFLNSLINYNKIANNSDGLENADTTQTVDATNNWWGNSSGPSGVGSGLGDSVSSHVIYTPWLMSPRESLTIVSTPSHVDAYGPLNSYALVNDLISWDPLDVGPKDTFAANLPGVWAHISGATWISTAFHPETNGDSWRWFHKDFTLPCTAYNISGSMDVNSDNAEEAYLNGIMLYTTGYVQGLAPSPQPLYWDIITPTTISPIPGDNSFDFIVRNWVYSGYNWTGLTFKAVINYEIPAVIWQPPLTNESFELKDGTTMPFKFKLYTQAGDLIIDQMNVYLKVFGPSDGGIGDEVVAFWPGEGGDFLRFDLYESYYIGNFRTKDYGLTEGETYTAVVFDGCTDTDDALVLGTYTFVVSAGKGNRGNKN